MKKCKDCTVFGCQHRTTYAEKDCYYEQWTAKESFNWQSFRAEAAKDILSNALIPYALKEFDEETINIEYWTGKAVEWADAIMKKLKEKEEK